MPLHHPLLLFLCRHRRWIDARHSHVAENIHRRMRMFVEHRFRLSTEDARGVRTEVALDDRLATRVRGDEVGHIVHEAIDHHERLARLHLARVRRPRHQRRLGGTRVDHLRLEEGDLLLAHVDDTALDLVHREFLQLRRETDRVECEDQPLRRIIVLGERVKYYDIDAPYDDGRTERTQMRAMRAIRRNVSEAMRRDEKTDIPPDAVAIVIREFVMKVVIALTEREKRGDDTVARRTIIIERMLTEEMRNGVHAERRVMSEEQTKCAGI
jgi:hypothetical protein